MTQGDAEPVNLPWVEKYRPQKLDDLISHTDIIRTRTGKTSTILACAKQLYAPKEFSSMVLELNASDDRGIGIVRGDVLNFASTRTVFNKGFKLIILDEADAMTNDAQNALRRIIERFTENTRFCLICNYLSKIIPALQSRCTRFRFGPLSPSQILPRLEYVIEKEKVTADEDGKKALMDLAEGDMRRVLNVLQSTSMAFDEVSEANVYMCCGQPTKADIQKILGWLMKKDVSTAYKLISSLQAEKGLALQDMITRIHPFVHKLNFPAKVKYTLLIKMANIENQLAAGGSERLQLGAFIGSFYTAVETKSRDA
ncbi:Replication factor C subunit 5 [Halotydeus destructor]|nr:Replication factor C subunit 5 [Halotydeus destructor]